MKICCYLFNGLLNVFDHKVIKTSTSKRIVSFDSRGSWSVFQKFQKCILIEGFKSFCKKSSKQVGPNNRKIDFRIMKKKTRPWKKKPKAKQHLFAASLIWKRTSGSANLRNFGWWQSRWIEKWIWRWSMKFLLTDLMAAVKGWPRHRKTRVRRPSGPRRLCKQSLWT